jgi:hypothetical protein
MHGRPHGDRTAQPGAGAAQPGDASAATEAAPSKQIWSKRAQRRGAPGAAAHFATGARPENRQGRAAAERVTPDPRPRQCLQPGNTPGRMASRRGRPVCRGRKKAQGAPDRRQARRKGDWTRREARHKGAGSTGPQDRPGPGQTAASGGRGRARKAPSRQAADRPPWLGQQPEGPGGTRTAPYVVTTTTGCVSGAPSAQERSPRGEQDKRPPRR